MFPGVTTAFGSYGENELNQGVYTIMSYNHGYESVQGSLPSDNYGDVATPMALDIAAIPEGHLVFPHEPLLRVVGPLLQAQLVETLLLNILNFQTLVATKASSSIRPSLVSRSSRPTCFASMPRREKTEGRTTSASIRMTAVSISMAMLIARLTEQNVFPSPGTALVTMIRDPR